MSLTTRTVAVVAAASSVAKSGQSTYTVTLPSDVTSGELALLTMHIIGGVVPTTPTGWTLVKSVVSGSIMGMYTWSKVLTPTDSSTTVDVVFATGVRGTATCVLAKGGDGTPVAATATSATGTLAATASGVVATTSAASSLVLEFFTLRPGTAGATATMGSDGGFTELYDYSTVATASVNATAAIYSIPVATASTITAPTFTVAGSTVTYLGYAISLAPAAVLAAPTKFTRTPGTIEFGLYTGPASPLLPLKVIGMYDGRVVRPIHLSWFDGTVTQAPVVTSGFQASGLDGAGFQNEAVQSPFTIPSGPNAGARPIIDVADVAGVHRSLDRGVTWVAVNGAKNQAGNDVGLPTHVASALWSTAPAKAGTCYVLTDSGLYRSTDYGAVFRQRAINVDAAGNGKVGTLEIDGREHPRHTGGLMAESEDGTCLWIASKSGLKLTRDGGATQSGAEAFAADHVRAVAIDPNDPTKLYVGIHNDGSGDATRNGVWQVTDATTTMAATSRLGTSWPFTRGCEQLWVDDNAGVTTVYAAAHNAGCASWRSGAWVVQNSGLDSGQNLAFQALHGVRTGGSVRLIIGGSGFGAGSTPARNKRYIFYGTVNNTTGVVTWTCATNPATVSDVNFGGTGLSFISNISYQDFGNNNDWVSSSLFFDIDDPNRVYSAGRGGVWVGQRNTTSGAWSWQPSTRGLMVTVNMSVVTNPLVPGQAHIGSMDYTQLATDDNGATFDTTGIAGAGAPSTGDAASYDGLPIAGQPVGLLVGASVRGAPTQDTANSAYFSDNPRSATPNWQKLDFAGANSSPAQPAGGTYDVVGVCLGRTAPGGSRVFMALVNQVGVFRKVNLTGTWNKVTDLPLPAGSRPIAFWAWRPNTSTVFCHIGTGVYRSDDAGANWVKIYNATTTTYGRWNTLVVDSLDTSKLYVSNGPDGLVRLDNPVTSTAPANTTVTTLTATGVGAIAMHRPTGKLFADVPGSGALLKWDTPRTSVVNSDVSDQFKRDNGKGLRSIGVTDDGWLLTADNGQGTMRARVVGTAAYPPDYGVLGTYVPNAATSGVPDGTVLTQSVGNMTITTPGTVLDSLDIHGIVIVNAANVTIKRCILRGRSGSTNEAVVMATGSAVSNLVIQDCDIIPEFPSVWTNGVNGHDFTVRRCDISRVVDGMGVFNTNAPGTAVNVFIEGNYIHDFYYGAPDVNHSSTDNQTHNDGVQIQGGLGVTIRGNNIQAYYTSAPGVNLGVPPALSSTNPAISCVLFNVNVGTTGGHTIIDNTFGGGRIPINCGGATGGVNLGSMLRNKFDRGSYTPAGQDPETIKLRSDQTCDTGIGTGNQNTFTDGSPVTVRTNG